MIAHHNTMRFEIVCDQPEVGVYLYVYDRQGKCIRDELQNDIATCKEVAFEKFGVPMTEWG